VQQERRLEAPLSSKAGGIDIAKIR